MEYSVSPFSTTWVLGLDVGVAVALTGTFVAVAVAATPAVLVNEAGSVERGATVLTVPDDGGLTWLEAGVGTLVRAEVALVSGIVVADSTTEAVAALDVAGLEMPAPDATNGLDLTTNRIATPSPRKGAAMKLILMRRRSFARLC